MTGVVIGERRLQGRLLTHASGVAPPVAVLQDARGGAQVGAGLEHLSQAEAEPGQVPAVDLRQAEIDASARSDERRGLRDGVVNRDRCDGEARSAVHADRQRIEPALHVDHGQKGLGRDARRALRGKSNGGGEAEGHGERLAVKA